MSRATNKAEKENWHYLKFQVRLHTDFFIILRSTFTSIITTPLSPETRAFIRNSYHFGEH